MNIFIYTIFLTVFLNEWNVVFGGAAGSTPQYSISDEFDIDELNYQGDPIRFSCISSYSYVFQILDFSSYSLIC